MVWIAVRKDLPALAEAAEVCREGWRREIEGALKGQVEDLPYRTQKENWGAPAFRPECPQFFERLHEWRRGTQECVRHIIARHRKGSRFPRIDYRDFEANKVLHIPRHQRQVMLERCSGNQAVEVWEWGSFIQSSG